MTTTVGRRMGLRSAAQGEAHDRRAATAATMTAAVSLGACGDHVTSSGGGARRIADTIAVPSTKPAAARPAPPLNSPEKINAARRDSHAELEYADCRGCESRW